MNNFNLITRANAPVKQPNRPVASQGEFVEGNNNNPYLSFDKVKLSIGDIVYQMAEVPGEYKALLREFTVKELLKDGRITISGSIVINKLKNDNTYQVAPSQVHTNKEEFVKHYLRNILFKINVELPTYYNSLIDILKGINPEYKVEELVVGQEGNETI